MDNLDTSSANVDTSSPNNATTLTPFLDTSNSNMDTSSNIATMTPNHDTSTVNHDTINKLPKRQKKEELEKLILEKCKEEYFKFAQIAEKAKRNLLIQRLDTTPNLLSVISFSLHLQIHKKGNH